MECKTVTPKMPRKIKPGKSFEHNKFNESFLSYLIAYLDIRSEK
jgi:hypothetical protein